MNIQKIKNIVQGVKGKGVEQRRISALEAAGYNVEFKGSQHAFGVSGEVMEVSGEVLAQLSCNRLGKAANGFGLKMCDVYVITRA